MGTPTPADRVLAAALLWARNHLEVTTDRALLDRVIERIDKVLENREPSIADMQAFREFYGDK